jgi:hypothetical protein
VKKRWRKYGNPVECGGRYFVLIDHAGLGSAFSPIPTNRHLGPFALCPWDNSACRAFHSSTALITTTSLIVFKDLVKVLVVVIEVLKNSGVQVALAWRARFPRISTGILQAVGFILLIKASTVRQRWKSGEEPK